MSFYKPFTDVLGEDFNVQDERGPGLGPKTVPKPARASSPGRRELGQTVKKAAQTRCMLFELGHGPGSGRPARFAGFIALSTAQVFYFL